MMEPTLSELDAGFEPQQRARSNTWPLPRPDNFGEIKEEPGIKCPGGVVLPCGGVMGPESTLAGGLQLPTATKKNSSRRNAWGNLSYADLITQAITSAPEKRLTLSQIYEWMVQNVPYFKDKGDSNSSAGWKNSIRHNLSLHNRFMRVQNEGTGKSSWWMINPDAKPGKSARRRATSMETSKFEKRRGRVKKKVDALRNGLQAATDATPSPSSSISEGLDLYPDSPLHNTSFQLSPDFRQRASSNASSCGRLSPIPAAVGDQEWCPPAPYSGDGEFMQKTSVSLCPPLGSTGYGPEQLAGNLAEGMKLQGGEFLQSYGGGNGGSNGQHPPPPPYQSPYEYGGSRQGQQHDFSTLHAASPYGLSQCHIHRMGPCSCHLQQQQHSPAGMSPSYPQSEPSPDPMSGQQQAPPPPPPQGAQFMPPRALRPPPGGSSNGDSPPGTPTPSTMMGQLMGALNNSTLLDDLNLNIETLHGFDCNVDEVIKHELSMDGSLDFNFSQHNHHHQAGASVPPNQELQQGVVPQQPTSSYSTTVSTGPSWVH